jgi:hypothetical protein
MEEDKNMLSLVVTVAFFASLVGLCVAIWMDERK